MKEDLQENLTPEGAETIKGILAQTKKEAIQLTDEEMNMLTDDRSIATPEEKMTAVMTWYLTGSNTKAAVATGNPEVRSQLIYRWRKSKWWGVLIEKCRQIRNEEIEQLQTVIYFTALEKLQDAIQYGDHKYDGRSGEVVRVPVSAKDLAYLTNTISEQRAHSMHRDVGEKKTTNDLLKDIASALTKNAHQIQKTSGVTVHEHTPEGEIIDVDDPN